MSLLLARIARALTTHWIRGLLGALVVLSRSSASRPQPVRRPTTSRRRGPRARRRSISFRRTSRRWRAARRRSSSTRRTARSPTRRTAKWSRRPWPRSRARPLKPTVVGPVRRGRHDLPGRQARVRRRPLQITPARSSPRTGAPLIEAARDGGGKNGVEVSARGVMVDIGSEQEAPVGELVGIGIAIILLWVLFRSSVAMLVTLLGALHRRDVRPDAAGGAVEAARPAVVRGVHRHDARPRRGHRLRAADRRPLPGAGRGGRFAAAMPSAKSAATSGASVVAAGLIVMLAIAGLLVIGIPFIGKLGVGAAIAVGGVVVSALTVLPILIGAFRQLADAQGARARAALARLRALGHAVTARPWLSIAGGVLIMLIFAVPVTQLRLGQPDDGNQPEGKLQRIAYDRLSAAFGAGSNGPFIIAVDTAKGARTPTRPT